MKINLSRTFANKAMSRRQALALSGGSVIAAAFASPVSFADDSRNLDRSYDSLDRSIIAMFMNVSRFVCGHDHLSPLTGRALLGALVAQASTFSAQLHDLNDIISSKAHADVEALEVALKGQPLHPILLKIVKAWYAGVIEDGTSAKVYAFEQALMYQPSRDVVVIPTYAHNGPNYWLAEPTPVDIMPVF